MVVDAPVIDAERVLSRTVSPTVHVVDAAPVAVVVDVAVETLPPPLTIVQVTTTPDTGCPALVTCTCAGSVVPTTAVLSEKPESAAMFKPDGDVEEVSGGGWVVFASFEWPHAAAARTAATRMR